MRAALGEAIAAGPGARLPRLLFGQNGPSAPATETLYWLLVPSPNGYSVAEHSSPAAFRRGDVLVLDGAEYRVAQIGPSPFRDERPCAYLEPAG